MRDKEQQFIAMRADGITYDTISKELGVAKATLIKWNKQYSNEINNLNYVALQALIDEISKSKKERVEILINRINEINEALSKIDYATLSVKDLIQLLEHTNGQLEKETKKVSFHTNEFVPLVNYEISNEIIYDLEI